MDNVLLQPRARAFHFSYSHSYSPTSMSISWRNAFPSQIMVRGGLKNRRVKQNQKHIMACYFDGIPARDAKIGCGRYKGRMLGTLPSKYLRWMVKNIRPDGRWSTMAEEVLEDPVYRDRMEWEKFDEAIRGSGKNLTKISSVPNIPDLIRFSARFGWDPWGSWVEIDYNLLGTSKGKRIPRIKDNPKNQHKLNLLMKKKGLMRSSVSESLVSDNTEVKLDYKDNDDGSSGLTSEVDMRREARRERQKLKRGPMKPRMKTLLEEQPGDDKLFPGRGALLRRIREAESQA
ncbi:hypothetical protein KI387_007890 [Taxus chinensis]|uniref:Uncharacterized protein n=1 Tax=Taxus chinensis TaxID=29808 RepID=A0AA38LNE3_TAXCH|nr:hypothetical protein KI387_007890 [Taxus chinensis]